MQEFFFDCTLSHCAKIHDTQNVVPTIQNAHCALYLSGDKGNDSRTIRTMLYSSWTLSPYFHMSIAREKVFRQKRGVSKRFMV